ncbi:MAG: CHAP domain-containing protein [Saprospiraceae bacterium]
MNKLHIIIFAFSFVICNSFHLHTIEVGTKIDTYNGVDVYFNGKDFTNVTGRNVTEDGYNLGLKFQCVEFVKRYYYKVFNHKMPNAFGHAKDFFDKELPDKSFNQKRGLMQYRNVREYKPQINDILVYDKYPGNSFGHVAIISHIDDNQIEIVQQNMGLNSRIKIPLVNFYQYWTIADYHILGWLRKE